MIQSTDAEAAHRHARLAGALYLVIMVGGVVAEGYVRGAVYVSDDAVATAQRLLASTRTYRIGGAVEFVTLGCDLAVAVLLYRLLRAGQPTLALLAATFRVVFVAIFAVLSLAHFAALLLLQGGPTLDAFTPAQLQQAAHFSLRLHTLGFIIADVFFGVHCVLLGLLIVRAPYLPRVLGRMLVVAGACYLLDSLAFLTVPDWRARLFPWLLLPGFVAEGALALWLTAKGVNAAAWPGSDARV